ncbi:unnamed protein product [Rangifer tarandus platyrhynchus]|uniref:Uncharacterized protein n=2 Tax=Rangifer tarandus platyrhynchus TaxID=3082113 RepID=A0AC59Y155_RANTA|nr:unnamed protein product [Rangifer tarandus platyrhynchus]
MSRVGQRWLCMHGSFLASETPSGTCLSHCAGVVQGPCVYNRRCVVESPGPTFLANGTSAFLGLLFLGSLRPTGAESWECVQGRCSVVASGITGFGVGRVGPREAMVCEEQAVEGNAEVPGSPFRACKLQQPTVVLAAGRSRTLASCLSWAGLDTCRGARGGMSASGEAARSGLRAGGAGAQLVRASPPWPLLCGFPDSAALTCPRAQSHWQKLVASCREMFSSTLSLPPACQ